MADKYKRGGVKEKSKPRAAGFKRFFVKSKIFLWCGSLRRKILVATAAFVIFWICVQYGVAQWYKAKHSDEPLIIGTTFISDYAESFSLSPEETLNAIFSDLGIRKIRLVSYWKDIEPAPATYDVSSLDWQFAMAQKYDARVSLAIGLRQPRWPECHEPKWADIAAAEDRWKPQLYKYITAVVERYKNHPNLESYQLENEFFMKVFGECKNFNRDRLIEEYEMVKKLDPNHKIIISRSNNWIGVPFRQPTPDQFGISVYKRVWDAAFTKRYFEYPLPAWFYGMLAGWGEMVTGKDMMIHELQAEPWAPNGQFITEISTEEMFKSMNAERMKDRINYGVDTGMRELNLWGAEWWYWLMVQKDDDSVWEVVKEAVQKAELENFQAQSK